MKKIFSLGLLLCSAIPMIILIVNPYYTSTTNLINLLVTIAGLHVFSTAYLFSDRNILNLAVKFKMQLIIIPFLFILFSIIFFQEKNRFFTEFFLAFIVYQTWHFGAQNIGVSTFIAISTNSKKLSIFDKNIIKFAIISAILGVPYAIYPDFQIGAHYFNLSESEKLAIQNLNKIGHISAIIFSLISVPIVVKRFANKEFILGISLFISINFYLPIYLFKNPYTGFIFVLIAHGAQYLYFLFFHSINRRISFLGKAIALALPPTIYLSVIFIAHLLWQKLPGSGILIFPNLGLSLILGLTLAHFWIDQFIWKMKDRQRSVWITSSYSFILDKP